MSGIIGHSLYAVLALREAARRGLKWADVARRHQASYVAGAYLGSDIQVMPEAICVDTGREVGFGTVPLARSPITGGPVRQFKLDTSAGPLSATQVHALFYGRSHLLFGWTERDKTLRVPWDHLPDYFAAVVEDLFDMPGPVERPLAYTLGWIVHVVSDSLIKGQHPGIDLMLVDGRYTARNRPVQDLISYHEIGVRELGLDWPGMFKELAATPVEPIQLHYMRTAAATGRLGSLFSDGWRPADEPTVRAVLAENRRYVSHHAAEVLASMQLQAAPAGPQCSAELSQLSGLDYAAMLEAGKKAGFRAMLDTMAGHIVDMFEAVAQRSPRLVGGAAGKKEK